MDSKKKKEKAVINPKNSDEQCFKWTVITALHHEEISNNQEHVSKLKLFGDQYNWQGLEFPMALQKITRFEKNNQDKTP